MTPAAFQDPEVSTRLDPYSGVEAEQGNYVLAEVGQHTEQLPPEIFAVVESACREGEKHMMAGDFSQAFNRFMTALQTLPEPEARWNAAGWILVALGENSIRAGNWTAAEGPLGDAMWSPGTVGNPWVHLRLGQVHFELQRPEEAAEELARAYMGGGREIFADQHPKYIELVEQVLQPPPGMDHLP